MNLRPNITKLLVFFDFCLKLGSEASRVFSSVVSTLLSIQITKLLLSAKNFPSITRDQKHTSLWGLRAAAVTNSLVNRQHYSSSVGLLGFPRSPKQCRVTTSEGCRKPTRNSKTAQLQQKWPLKDAGFAPKRFSVNTCVHYGYSLHRRLKGTHAISAHHKSHKWQLWR